MSSRDAVTRLERALVERGVWIDSKRGSYCRSLGSVTVVGLPAGCFLAYRGWEDCGDMNEVSVPEGQQIVRVTVTGASQHCFVKGGRGVTERAADAIAEMLRVMLPARRKPRDPLVARCKPRDPVVPAGSLREPIVTHRSNGRGHLVDEVIIPLTGPAAEILRGALRAAQVHEADADYLAITGTGGLIAEMKRPWARRAVWTREELLRLLSSAGDCLHGLIARLSNLATEPAEQRKDKKAALRGVLDSMAAGSAVSPKLLGIVQQATLDELCQLNAELAAAADGVETASEDAVAALHLALAGETDHTLVVHGKCTTTVSIRQRWPDSKEAS